MTFFTQDEFETKYGVELEDNQLWLIEVASEMIYSQVGLIYRAAWTDTNVPLAIKNASMEQMRFLLEYDMPFLDNRGNIKAGAMESDLKTDYSTLALRILANNGYMYRGNPINTNMGMELPF